MLIGEALAASLRAGLEPVSTRMWRDLIRGAGVDLAPIVEGVRQEDFAVLERTLLGLAQEYWLAGESGDKARQRECRQLVIAAKDHAKLAARNPKVEQGKRGQKEEMVLWMMTWLENPSIFEMWVGLRKPRLTGARESPLG